MMGREGWGKGCSATGESQLSRQEQTHQQAKQHAARLAQHGALGLHPCAARLPPSQLNRLPAAAPILTRVHASAEAQLLCRVAPEGTRAAGIRVYHPPLCASGIC